MLEMIRLYFEQYPDKEAFFRIVGNIFPRYSSEYLLIENAYKLAKREFKEIYRDDDMRYFEHLRAVALIVILHLRVRDANVIAAAILHDVLEDIEGWDQERLAREFNSEVSQLVFWVTEPHLSEFDGDRERRNMTYHTKLASAPRDAIKIKLADRLHNIITLWSRPVENQEKKVIETVNFYLPLAEKHIILIHALEGALKEVRDSWK
jgi:GTP pyrophosphokinase